MAKRAHAYPQVTVRAAELVDTAVVTAPAGITAADAARLARKREAGVVAAGGGNVVAAGGGNVVASGGLNLQVWVQD